MATDRQPSPSSTSPRIDRFGRQETGYKHVSVSGTEDFAPLTPFFRTPLSIAVQPDNPARTFADLVAQTPDIDAVFCVNDDLALGVLFECQRRQISVPHDLAIVGFNDLEFTASAVPSLSSVRTNRYEMGRHAVTMVIDAIEGRRPREPVINLGFQLMVRESSTPQST